ncbi:hypothetical protein CHU98_g8273, partial [Xylaria longipes]
ARWHSDLAAHGSGNGEGRTQTTRPRTQTPVEVEAEAEAARRTRQSGADRTQTQRPPLGDISMEVDGQVDDVYTGDLRQVEEPPASAEASIEAGSPVTTQQRRQLRSHTMRLGRRTSFFIPTHARGYSDTTSTSMTGRTRTGMTPRTGFTSVNAPRDDYVERAVGVEVDDADPMWLD